MGKYVISEGEYKDLLMDSFYTEVLLEDSGFANKAEFKNKLEELSSYDKVLDNYRNRYPYDVILDLEDIVNLIAQGAEIVDPEDITLSKIRDDAKTRNYFNKILNSIFGGGFDEITIKRIPMGNEGEYVDYEIEAHSLITI